MSESCRVCGSMIRAGDDRVITDGRALHASCVEAPKKSKRRRIGWWAAMGSRGQMALGDVQRPQPD